MPNKNIIPGVKTFDYVKIIGKENIDFGKNIIIDDFVLIYASGKMKIGNHVHIASFVTLTGGALIEIGNFCAISHGVRVISGTDDFKDWGFGNSTISEEYRNVKRLPIKIGNFSIIGANSVILPGVIIGEGVSVGANSVVTKDLKPWGVYIGNKMIAKRNKAGILENFKKFKKDNAEEI